MEWPSAATEISWISLSKEPRRRELRRSQAYREQAEALSHTGSFDWNLSSGESVCSDEAFQSLRTLEASTDTRSRSSAYIQI